jgi:hypothetical protein
MRHLLKTKRVDSGGECAHFIFNKCPFYTHDGASAKCGTNSHEMDNSVHLQFEHMCKSDENIYVKKS